MIRYWSLTLKEGRAWIKRKQTKNILDKEQRKRVNNVLWK